VHDIRPAILLSQPVIARADIENQRPLVLQRIGKLNHRLRARVGNDERNTVFDMFFDLGNQLPDVALLDDLERELLPDEPTGRVVVVDGKPCTGHAFVRWRHVKKRERRRQIAPLAGEHDRDPVKLVRRRCLETVTACRRLARDGLCQGQPHRSHRQQQ
jgi:hypothetical protein